MSVRHLEQGLTCGCRMQAEGRMPRLEWTPAQRGGRQPTLGRGMSLSRWCKARQTEGEALQASGHC